MCECKYKLGHDRYEKLRACTVKQIADLFCGVVLEGANLDEMVDALGSDLELHTGHDGLVEIPQSDAMRALENSERRDEL